MLLSVQERLVLIEALPAQGNFVTLGLVTALKSELFLSQKDHAEFGVVTEGNQVRWDDSKARDKDIEIGDALRSIIVEALAELDTNKKLTTSHLSLYKKFILPSLEPVDQECDAANEGS